MRRSLSSAAMAVWVTAILGTGQLLGTHATAMNIPPIPPEKLNWLNARDFGAKGDGVTDDSAALSKAFKACEKSMKTCFLPAGTYLLADSIATKEFWLYIQGEGQDKTIIKLKDNCPGFTDPKTAKWMMATIGDNPQSWTDPDMLKKPGGLGGCNVGFFVYIQDLTLDTGKGNPGTIALHYISNNGGGIRRVTLRSGDGKGLCGLDLRRDWNGPCMITDLTIKGFDTGIVTGNWTYCTTFERLTLENQNKVGFLNREHSVAIRTFKSVNKVPALVNRDNDNSGPVILVDADLSGGAKDATAIESQGPVYVRNVKTAGYGKVLKFRGAVPAGVSGASIERYGNEPFRDVNGNETIVLDLPVKETPRLPEIPASDWANVMDFKPVKVSDKEEWGYFTYEATEAIQKAFDSGKRGIYFPHARYKIKSPLKVQGKVEVIYGAGSMLQPEFPGDTAVFSVEKTTAPHIFFERFRCEGSRRMIEHASGGLVVRDSIGLSYRSKAGCGDLFLDSVCVGYHGKSPFVPYLFEVPQKIWARDLNSESAQTKIINKAADLWVLGLKTEATGTTLQQSGQARTEFLGGLVYPVGGDWNTPNIVLEGGALSFIHGFFGCTNPMVKDLRNGATKELLYSETRKKTDRYYFFSTGK